VAPLWWHYRSPRRTVDLVVPPVAGVVASRGGGVTTRWLALGYWQSRPDGYRVGLAPLWHSGRRGAQRYDVLFPLFWSFRDAAAGARRLVIGPVYAGTSPRGTNLALAPLLFAGWSGAAVPPEARWHHFVLAPVFFHFVDRGAHLAATVVPPVYYYRHGASTYAGAVPLAFYRHTDTPRGPEDELTIPIPLIHWHRDPDHLRVFAWFYGRFRDDVAGTSSGWVMNYFWSRSPEHATRSLFPLLWWHDDAVAGSKLFVAAPLYWRFRGAHNDVDVLLPFWLHVADKDHGGETHFVLGGYWSRGPGGGVHYGLAPLWHSGVKGPRRYDVVFPLVWHFRDAALAERRLVLGPLYVGTSPEGWETSLAGVVWAGAAGAAGARRWHFHAAPLLWTWGDAARHTWTAIAGPAYAHAHATGWAAGVAPLVMVSHRAEGAAVPPALPAATAGAGDVDGDGASHGPSTAPAPAAARAAPYRKTTVTIPPLLTHVRVETGHARVFFPGFYLNWNRIESRHSLWLGPLVLHDTPETAVAGVAPLFWSIRDKAAGTSTFLGLPLVFSHKDALGFRDTVAFPLYWSFSGAGGSATVLLPFGGWASNTVSGGKTFFALPGVFWHKDPEVVRWGFAPLLVMHAHEPATGKGYTFALPFFVHRSFEDGWSLASPIAAGGNRGGRGWLWALNYYGSHSATNHTDVIFPLVWSVRGPHSAATVAAPFYIGYENHDDGTHVRIAPPLFWDVKTAHDHVSLFLPFYLRTESEARLTKRYGLYPLVYYRSEEGRGKSKLEGRALVPFYAWRKWKPGDLEWRVLGGLVGFERQNVYRRLILFWVFKPELKPLDHPVAAAPEFPLAVPAPARRASRTFDLTASDRDSAGADI
jgi:hypothetical protein